MGEPLVSIIIPNKDAVSILKKCLDSVIYPELDDYEIVLVNDGSTDKSGEICRECVYKVKFITEPF